MAAKAKGGRGDVRGGTLGALSPLWLDPLANERVKPTVEQKQSPTLLFESGRQEASDPLGADDAYDFFLRVYDRHMTIAVNSHDA